MQLSGASRINEASALVTPLGTAPYLASSARASGRASGVTILRRPGALRGTRVTWALVGFPSLPRTSSLSTFVSSSRAEIERTLLAPYKSRSFDTLAALCVLHKQRVCNACKFTEPALFERRLVVFGSASAAALIGLGVIAGGAVAASMAMAGGRNPQAARLATRRGMELFVQGDVEGSLKEFDRALELDESQRPYLWQRGLSMYYVDRFEEGATQFRDDVAVNPNDTEESIWCFLCEARITSARDARSRFLRVGRDPRPVMRAAYELFKNGGSPDELLAVGGSEGLHDTFYAALYVGLFHEAEGDMDAAKKALQAAVATPYGQRSSDYMAQLAKVHCKVRGWET